MTRFARYLFSLAFAGIAVPAVAQAPADVVSAGLMSGWRMESGQHMAAIHVRLAPGWKTYWRSPGDAGIPPSFDWSGSGNVAGVTVHWPVPHIFETNGLRSVGYSNELVLPVEISPQDAGAPISLVGRIDMGVCEDICIPVSLSVGTALPPTGAGNGSGAIRSALADRPMTAAEAGVGQVVCKTESISDGMRVTVTMDLPRIGASEDTVVEFSDKSVWVSEAVTTRDGGHLTAVAELVPSDAAPFALARDGLRFTVLGGDRAVDIHGCTGAG